MYFYFLQFQINVCFFIWQTWFCVLVYVLIYTHTGFLICPERQVVFQDKFVLDNHHLIGVDHSIVCCSSCSATIDKVIFHLLIKRRLCWTLLLAWTFQQLQCHPTFIQTASSPDGLRRNNNQTRQSWSNNSKDLTDQFVVVVDWLFDKRSIQPKSMFPCLFLQNKIKQCSCSFFLLVFVTVFSCIIGLNISNPNQFSSNFVRLSCFVIQRQCLFPETCGSVFNLNFSLQSINSFLRWNSSCQFFVCQRFFHFDVLNDPEMFHLWKHGIFNRWQSQFGNDCGTISFPLKQNQFFKHVNIPCVDFVRVCGNNISATFASLWIFHFFWNKKIKTLFFAGFIYSPQVINPVGFQILFLTFFHDLLQFLFHGWICLCRNENFNVGWWIWFNEFDFIDVHNVSWYFHKFCCLLQNRIYLINVSIPKQHITGKQMNANKFLILCGFDCSKHLWLIKL